MGILRLIIFGFNRSEAAFIRTTVELASGMDMGEWELVDGADADALLLNVDADLGADDKALTHCQQVVRQIVNCSVDVNTSYKGELNLKRPLTYPALVGLLKALQTKLAVADVPAVLPVIENRVDEAESNPAELVESEHVKSTVLEDIPSFISHASAPSTFTYKMKARTRRSRKPVQKSEPESPMVESSPVQAQAEPEYLIDNFEHPTKVESPLEAELVAADESLPVVEAELPTPTDDVESEAVTTENHGEVESEPLAVSDDCDVADESLAISDDSDAEGEPVVLSGDSDTEEEPVALSDDSGTEEPVALSDDADKGEELLAHSGDADAEEEPVVVNDDLDIPNTDHSAQLATDVIDDAPPQLVVENSGESDSVSQVPNEDDFMDENMLELAEIEASINALYDMVAECDAEDIWSDEADMPADISASVIPVLPIDTAINAGRKNDSTPVIEEQKTEERQTKFVINNSMLAMERPARRFYEATRFLGLLKGIIDRDQVTELTHPRFQPVRIYPEQRVYASPLDDALVPELFRTLAVEFSSHELGRVSDREPPKKWQTQPLWKLLFIASLYGSEGRLRENYDPYDKLELIDEPDYEILPNALEYKSIADCMRGEAADLKSISDQTGVRIETVIDFCNACEEVLLVNRTTAMGRAAIKAKKRLPFLDGEFSANNRDAAEVHDKGFIKRFRSIFHHTG